MKYTQLQIAECVSRTIDHYDVINSNHVDVFILSQNVALMLKRRYRDKSLDVPNAIMLITREFAADFVRYTNDNDLAIVIQRALNNA